MLKYRTKCSSQTPAIYDFCVWLPNGSKVCRVLPDLQFRTENLPKLKLFWQEHVVPELITRTLECRAAASTSDKPSTHHCSCGAPDKNPMIGCDDANCPVQWYHWECVGLVREPRGNTWYCDNCKGHNVQKKRPRK